MPTAISKPEKRESCPRFEHFLLCLTRLSQRELILARRLALTGYGMEGKRRKKSPERKV
ncbi:MAG TPA: hypothetical protein VK901_20755 [Nitrospiraceae bacterium]|nr:hypothetical protein [Nitrospiraceae bacterium]